jgi:hypothetical protein
VTKPARIGFGHLVSKIMGASDDSRWGETGNGEAKSTATAKDPVHISESAYAHLASLLIGDPRAQAALGVFRDSGRESDVGAKTSDRCASPQTTAGAHSSRPSGSSRKEEIVVSDSDDEVVEFHHSATVLVSRS